MGQSVLTPAHPYRTRIREETGIPRTLNARTLNPVTHRVEERGLGGESRLHHGTDIGPYDVKVVLPAGSYKIKGYQASSTVLAVYLCSFPVAVVEWGLR